MGDLNFLTFDKFIEYKIYEFYSIENYNTENSIVEINVLELKKFKRPKGHFNISDLSGTSAQLE